MVLPTTLETLGIHAFTGCKGLEGKLEIPEGIKEIKVWTFKGCEQLTSFVLPSTIVKIDDKAFADCLNLEGTISTKGITVSLTAFEGTKVTVTE